MSSLASYIQKDKKAPVRSSKKPAVRFADVDLDENDASSGSASAQNSGDEDEDEDDGDADEFIDVLDIFDGRGEAADENDAGKVNTQRPKEHSDSESRDEGEVEDEDEESDGDEQGSDTMIGYDSDVEDPSPEALASLENFISTLDPSRKRKASAEETAEAPVPRKRRTIKERTEAGGENEFAAKSSGEWHSCHERSYIFTDMLN